MPHVSTLHWEYGYSKSGKLTAEFVKRMEAYRKKWALKYLTVVFANIKIKTGEKGRKIAERLLRKPQLVGLFYLTEGFRDVWINYFTKVSEPPEPTPESTEG